MTASSSHAVLGFFDRFAAVAVIALLLSGLPLAALGFVAHSI